MKRILALLLVFHLCFSLVPPVFAADEHDIWALSTHTHINYDGYFIHVHPEANERIVPLSLDMEAFGDNLFLVACLDEARSVWQADDVLYIEPNFEIVLFQTANSPYLGRQWSIPFLSANRLWEQNLTGSGVRVAIIDSGIMRHHANFNQTRIATGFNFLNNNTNVEDHTGHGTQIAGILAAGRNNGIGTAGLLSELTIIPLKVFDHATSNVSVAIRAIYDAVSLHNADILNLSWGIPGGASSRALENAIDFAYESGVIIVAAAGNNGTTARIYPAAFERVISVAAVDRHGQLAHFSQRNAGVFVAAPGVSVLTTGHAHPVSHVYASGTSFAAPFVTALAAVLLEVRPDATPADFAALLRQSVVPNAAGGRNHQFGYGTIYIPRFLAALDGQPFFADISTHWARESIENLVSMGLFTGTAPNTFSPDEHTSRASFVTILGRLYREMGGYIPRANDHFSDTQNNSWYSDYIAWAYAAHITLGTEDNRFLPHDIVTRQEAAVFLNRFFRHIVSGGQGDENFNVLHTFADHTQISPWALSSLVFTTERGLITGAPGANNTRLLLPQNPSTRAEIAVIIERFTQNVISER